MSPVRSDGRTLVFSGAIDIGNLNQIDVEVQELLQSAAPGEWVAELGQLQHIDTAGAIFLHRLPTVAEAGGHRLQLQNLP